MNRSQVIRLFLMICFGGVVLSVLAGCQTYRTAPGNVVGTAPKDAGQNSIVTFTVKGKGVEPEAAVTKGQARLMAERAAVIDGYRQFVEKIKGVYVEAYTKAGYGAVEQDLLKTATQSLLRGVEVKEITHGEYGIATALMTLRVNFTRHGMIWWPQGLGPHLVYAKK